MDLTVCIVVNGEKFQSHMVNLTLIRQCPMSNSLKRFSYTTWSRKNVPKLETEQGLKGPVLQRAAVLFYKECYLSKTLVKAK